MKDIRQVKNHGMKYMQTACIQEGLPSYEKHWHVMCIKGLNAARLTSYEQQRHAICAESSHARGLKCYKQIISTAKITGRGGGEQNCCKRSRK